MAIRLAIYDCMDFSRALLFIFCVTLAGQGLLASVPGTIELGDEYASIRCASGVDVSIPKGTVLEVSEHRVGRTLIVKVPKEWSSLCEYGLLKYRGQGLLNTLRDEKVVQSRITRLAIKNSAKTLKRARVKVKHFVKVAEKMKYSPRCTEEFVGDEGLGDWGRFVKRELASGQYPELLSNNKAFKHVCPGFRTMSLDEKKNLWVFILMSMSHYESSCRTQVKAQGPYGIAKGLLQLHEGSENRYSHWDREGICKKGDSRKPKGSLQCTLSMLNGQVEKFDSIFFKKSYWDVLRNVQRPSTHASKIRAAIQMLPGCGGRTVASTTRRTSAERYGTINSDKL